MELHNYMEDVVEKVISELISDPKNFCTCQQCRKDVAAFALNRLQPRYVATHKGLAFTEIDVLSAKFRTEVVREVKKAMNQVKQQPKHRSP